MAKNIASNTRMIEQNAQYDIGSNIISRTSGGYDNNVLLSDLQLIKLERDKNGERIIDYKKVTPEELAAIRKYEEKPVFKLW